MPVSQGLIKARADACHPATRDQPYPVVPCQVQILLSLLAMFATHPLLPFAVPGTASLTTVMPDRDTHVIGL